jgi:protein translocase SecG subunit
MTNIIGIAQIIISVLLMAAILFQQRGTGSSAIMGGASASYYTKRGFEKILFVSTIVLVVLFVATAIINILLS